MATAGKILMFPVGNWTSGNNYGFLDIVYFGGSSYIAKTDITNSTVDPATDTTNWQILARGYLADTLSEIDGIDTSGLIGTAGDTVSSQTLIDKIADMVADKLVLKTAISNQQVNDTTKVTGSALSYSMNETLTTLSGNLDKIGTFQGKVGNGSTIAPNARQWMCDWFTISAGTYLMGFNSVNTANVDTYLKISDNQPTLDINPRELLCVNSGNAVKVVTITSDKWVSVLIDNHSASNYTIFADPGAFFAWTLRIK